MKDKIVEVDLTLSNMDKTEKGVEKLEEVKPETINIPNYEYWMPNNTLDARVALRNLNVWSQSFIWETTLPASTGNTVITWVWFQPKSIILICANGNNEWASWGFSDWTKNYSLWQWWSWWTSISTTASINVQDVWYPSTFIWTVSALSSDWFTINISSQSWVPTLKVIYLAIW